MVWEECQVQEKQLFVLLSLMWKSIEINIPRVFQNPFWHKMLRVDFRKNKEKRGFSIKAVPSHTSNEAISFFNRNKIINVKREEWMPSSPNAAPIDYSIRRYLKQRLNKTNIESLDELKRNNLSEWKKRVIFILITYEFPSQKEFVWYIRFKAII